MGVRHIPDGQDFGSEHFPKDFGFSGSGRSEARAPSPERGKGGDRPVQATTKGYHHPTPDAEPDYPGDGGGHYAKGGEVSRKPRSGRGEADNKSPFPDVEGFRHPTPDAEPDYPGDGGGHYSHGGEVHPHGHDVMRTEHRADGTTVHHHRHGGHSVEHVDGHMTHHHHDGRPVEHRAEGGGMDMHIHPHGHHVVKVEHHSDGRIVHHHAHGGHSVHHIDGHISHHEEDGSPVGAHHMSMGGIEGHHDESEYVHRSRGGRAEHSDMAEDKRMIKSAFRQHDEHEHHGAHEDIHLAKGGYAGKPVRLPRSMKPVAERSHSPIDTPPKMPSQTRTPPNDMSGGQMPYGVQPSDESGGMGGSGPGAGADESNGSMPGLKHGGRAR